MVRASDLRLDRIGEPSEFERLAGPFLVTREAENNLAIGLIANIQRGRNYGGDAPYFAVVTFGDEVVGAAMRAGLYLIVTAGTSDDALELLVADAAGVSADVPGVVGPNDLARRAADLWQKRTGRLAKLGARERIYQLERVIAPKPVSGAMRRAVRSDLGLVAQWMHAFIVEAQPYLTSTPDQGRANAERWIEGGGLRLWEDGDVVSMAGASGPTPNGIRVGAVYTPPGRRKRGYASALVAALSQEQLDSGKRFCFLYTDLANPTSNKIYQDIGYEPVIDVEEWHFAPA